MTNKKFSKRLLNENDPQSRKIAKEFFAKRGLILKDNPKKFGIDLIGEDGSMWELEHRWNWVSGQFPYDTVNIPRRKDKFLAEGKAYYVILSADYSTIGYIKPEIVAPYMVSSNLHENSNVYVRKDEYFFKVPTINFEFFDVKNGTAI